MALVRSFKFRYSFSRRRELPAWHYWKCCHSGAEDKLRTLKTKQERRQRSVRTPIQSGQMLSLCRKAAVSLSFSWDTQKSRRGVARWNFCLLGWEMYQKKNWPIQLSGKERWLSFLQRCWGREEVKCCIYEIWSAAWQGSLPLFWTRCLVFGAAWCFLIEELWVQSRMQIVMQDL